MTPTEDMDHPSRLGTVWIAYHGQMGAPHWTGYWDQEPNGPPAMLEQGPGWSAAREAIAWGLQRSTRVLIRLDDQGRYWWAGEGEPSDPSLDGTIMLGEAWESSGTRTQ